MIESIVNGSRRTFLRLFTQAALLGGMGAKVARAGGPVAPGKIDARVRDYRAHATILLLSIPVFTRRDVGAGYVTAEQCYFGSKSITALQFAGGSNPARAQGLNRVGIMQELLHSTDGKLSEIVYFGVMTASPEESVEQAKKALKQSGGAQLYTAAEGRITPAGASTSVHRFEVKDAFGWSGCKTLLARAKDAVASSTHLVRRDQLPAEGAAGRTFLAAMHEAIMNPAPQWSAGYTYNGQQYRLTTKKEDDRGTGEDLKKQGVTSDARLVYRLSGVTQNVRTGKKTPFRLWVDRSQKDGLPLRIEYQARSFLRLVFEANNSGQTAADLLLGNSTFNADGTVAGFLARSSATSK